MLEIIEVINIHFKGNTSETSVIPKSLKSTENYNVSKCGAPQYFITMK